ncbi:phosphate ABC transporter ATP-binding protein [Alkalibacillus silvisoli]|uniref:Amino acid ABC transporter ATP-binding protein n=1 Tax=Alkalibacillus silvisoli TaxID=392823 RepID=A0ABN0ZT32_9BACI
MTNHIFQFNQVNRLILKDVNFKVNEGERLIIFGPSGSGKSTLLHLFNRMDDPDQGEIYFQQQLINDYDIPQLRKKVGLVLQQPHLFPETVLDNLKFGPSMFDEWEEERAYQLLNYVNLPKEYLTKPVEELSGGEQQRVSLARTLANKPDVLLLDEPTSALDDRNIEAIEEDLINLIEQHSLTVVMVTHSMDQAKRIGTKGLFIDEGQVIEFGDIAQLLETPKTEELKNFLHKS